MSSSDDDDDDDLFYAPSFKKRNASVTPRKHGPGGSDADDAGDVKNNDLEKVVEIENEEEEEEEEANERRRKRSRLGGTPSSDDGDDDDDQNQNANDDDDSDDGEMNPLTGSQRKKPTAKQTSLDIQKMLEDSDSDDVVLPSKVVMIEKQNERDLEKKSEGGSASARGKKTKARRNSKGGKLDMDAAKVMMQKLLEQDTTKIVAQEVVFDDNDDDTNDRDLGEERNGVSGEDDLGTGYSPIQLVFQSGKVKVEFECSKRYTFKRIWEDFIFENKTFSRDSTKLNQLKFDGDKIDWETDTPNSLEMDDGDCIDVILS
jgi:hypothetical protein